LAAATSIVADGERQQHKKDAVLRAAVAKSGLCVVNDDDNGDGDGNGDGDDDGNGNGNGNGNGDGDGDGDGGDDAAAAANVDSLRASALRAQSAVNARYVTIP
jgi:hypothetical protein